MTRITAIFFAALAAACATEIPEPTNAPIDAPTWAGDETSRAIADVRHIVPDTDLGGVWLVRWFDGPCLDYGDGTPGCITGKTWIVDGDISGDRVVIDLVAARSLPHEVAHMMRWFGAGAFDDGHPQAWWADVDTLGEACAARTGER